MKNASSWPADWLLPDWPSIAGVQAVFTSRNGGVSQAPWDSFNLGDHVGDAPHAVATNRQRFAAQLGQSAGRPVTPHFLQQVHGVQVCQLPLAAPAARAFDACVSDQIGHACTIMVADCLPILIAHRECKVIGAAHAGWRGLAGLAGVGVVEQLWQAFCRLVQQQQACNHAAIAEATQVWLGPCIGQQAFEVGAEVVHAFTGLAEHTALAGACFSPGARSGKFQADLAALARQRWRALGVRAIYGNDSSANWCTATHASRFFSHRRDAGIFGSTGRMAAAIWRSI